MVASFYINCSEKNMEGRTNAVFKNIEYLVYMSRPEYFHSNIEVSERISNISIIFTEIFSIFLINFNFLNFLINFFFVSNPC